MGSPPRGRGKVSLFAHINVCKGITPAWAGKRSAAPPHWQLVRDHPRVGGEKSLIYLFPFFRLGSPPRRRGKAEQQATMDTVDRITPAWAGKRPSAPAGSSWARDHPRMGGEKCAPASILPFSLGSPPHGRGKGPHLEKTAVRGGITPAWAGKRAASMRNPSLREDHPRMGGEKTKKIP